MSSNGTLPMSLSSTRNPSNSQLDYTSGGFPGAASPRRIPAIFRRLHKFHQMDFEVAAWQLTYLCIAPRRVSHHQVVLTAGSVETKNTWARDDPAILVLMAGAIAFVSVLWSIVYFLPPLLAIRLFSVVLLRDFLFSSIIVATCLYFLSNFLLRAPPSRVTPESTRVEWGYTFDVAVNSFFPCFLTLGVAQLILVSVITCSKWVCLWVGNTLYLVAVGQYVYGLYLGISSLPFLSRTEILVFPLLPLFCAYVISLLGFNVAKTFLDIYFG